MGPASLGDPSIVPFSIDPIHLTSRENYVAEGEILTTLKILSFSTVMITFRDTIKETKFNDLQNGSMSIKIQ